MKKIVFVVISVILFLSFLHATCTAEKFSFFTGVYWDDSIEQVQSVLGKGKERKYGNPHELYRSQEHLPARPLPFSAWRILRSWLPWHMRHRMAGKRHAAWPCRQTARPRQDRNNRKAICKIPGSIPEKCAWAYVKANLLPNIPQLLLTDYLS